MKINRGDSQDKGSQSRQAYHAAPAPAPKRPVQPAPAPQDLYEDADGFVVFVEVGLFMDVR